MLIQYTKFLKHYTTCHHARIPQRDPSRESVLLPPAEFKRLTSTSWLLLKEDREALRQAYQRKKEEDLVGKLTAILK